MEKQKIHKYAIVLIIVICYYGLQYIASAVHFNCKVLKDDCVPPISLSSEFIYQVMVHPPWLNQFQADQKEAFLPTDTKQETDLKQIEVLLMDKSKLVLKSLKNKDIESFKKLIRPTIGVRFSKDGVVFLETDKKFDASEIDDLIKNNKVVLWGYADGSGNPIQKTFLEYISQYSDPDFSKAPQIAFDKALRPSANTTNNITEEYRDGHFVSFYYPYTSTYINEEGKEVPQELSWESLNLVFKEYDGNYYLIGIVKDNWTI